MKIPSNLHPLAVEVLEAFRGHRVAENIVLGGGVALNLYHEFRPTADIDAWWAAGTEAEATIMIKGVVQLVARQHGFSINERKWGGVLSLEMVGADKRKVFSFQIAERDIELGSPVDSPWPPVLLESFSDNLGSKMCALVNRGAPRDFVDIARVCRDGLTTPDVCWALWLRKSPGMEVGAAKIQVLRHLERIESSRPLTSIAEDRLADATYVREFMRNHFSHDRGIRH